jgi:hypothetical protein
MGSIPFDLQQILFSLSHYWPIGECHVALSDWSMCHAFIGPPVSSPVYLPPHIQSPSTCTSMSCMDATSSCMDDMWHFFIGPHGPPKMPKMSDTWQPVMLPCHHADISMTSSVSCMTCMDMPRGILWACHVAPPLTFDLFDQTLTAITSSYELCLRRFLCRWKAIVELYAMKSVFKRI